MHHRENDLIPISVLVQTKNEAIGIKHCLAALKNFGEIIVVDSASTDGTAEIARSMGATVIDFLWDGKYPKKKQWQLDNVQTKYQWVLFLDADETPSAQLSRFLRSFDQESRSTPAYDLQLVYKFDGRLLHHGHRVVKRALVHRERVHFPEVADLDAPGMGELEGHYQPVADGKPVKLRDALIHDDKDPVSTWFDRHNRYSDWEAFLRMHRTHRSSVARFRSRQGQLFSIIPAKPLLFFAYAYLYRGGVLDGAAGFNYALAQSFYYWQISLKVREARRKRRSSMSGAAK